MCGIVAQFNKTNQAVDKAKIIAMAEDIQHRGPDDEGFYFGDWFGLGHKRLSIIDLSSRGHQPMFDESGRFVIAYNGELYNYIKLRNDLTSLGCKFFSDSDTEVILKSYMTWGSDCLMRFVGMFAFVVVDLTKYSAFVARDQLGIKPLYYYEKNDSIAFASEIKCLRHLTRFSINEDALYEQFFLRYVSGKRTIFKDIYRLSAGSYMVIDKGKQPKIVQYYDVCSRLKESPGIDIDYSGVEDELNKSIYAHTVSDVGYNIQLSGGIDSSYITAVLAQKYNHTLHTFSVELDGFEHDESHYQKIVSQRYETIHHRYSMGGREMADYLPLATWHMDMPIIHTSCVLLMILCLHSRQHSKVMLTGEGADEMFGGYGRYTIPLQIKIAFLLKRLKIKPDYLPEIYKFKGLRKLLSRDLGIDEQINFPDDSKFLYSDLKKDLSYRKHVADPFPDILSRIFASDQTSHLNSLLERQDKMSMAMSVETRVPFCTFPLFDMVNAINPKKKITPYPKIILKKLTEKYFNNDFIYRKKIGFLLPVAKWLNDEKTLGKYLDLLTDTTFRQRGYYNIAEVEKAVDDHIKKGIDRSKDLMNIIKFEVWHRMFIDKQASNTL